MLEPKPRTATVIPTNLSISPALAHVGDTLRIALTVANVGEVPVSDLTLAPVLMPSNIAGCVFKFEGVPLAAGRSYTYTASATAVQGGIGVGQVTGNMITYRAGGKMMRSLGDMATNVQIANRI